MWVKKKSVINLIRYYSEKNDAGFRSEAYEIAREFDKTGDIQLSEYIMALLSDANAFVPQEVRGESAYLRKASGSPKPLPLPDVIADDVKGVINAIGHNAGINKYLFEGSPGTGKTETAKHIARILERELFSVDFDALLDSRLGQSAKNIAELFREINGFAHPDKVVVLFDEIDALALDRTNSNDVREMGRATTAVLKGLDGLDERIVLIATTNLFDSFDKALVRRFDSVIDFNRYSHEDLLDVAEALLGSYLNRFKFAGRNMKLFRKIMQRMPEIPFPGELENLLKTSIAFSDVGNSFDYLRRLYKTVGAGDPDDLKELQAQGFTMREIEILSGVSKSTAARELKES